MVLEHVEARAHMAGPVSPLEGVGSMVGKEVLAWMEKVQPCAISTSLGSRAAPVANCSTWLRLGLGLGVKVRVGVLGLGLGLGLELQHLCALGRLALAQILPKVADEQGRHAGDPRARSPQIEPRIVNLVPAPQLLELGCAEQR